MFTLSSAFESLDIYNPAHAAWSAHPCTLPARLSESAAEAEGDSESDWDTSSNPSIFDTDDESDFGSIISQADEEFKGTPLSSIPPHVLDEYPLTRIRQTLAPFVYGRSSPLRATWTAQGDEEIAAGSSLVKHNDGLKAVAELSAFCKDTTVTTVVLCWADDDLEGVEELDDLLAFFSTGKRILPSPGG